VGDFNDDGYPEVFVGSNQTLGEGNQSGTAYLIDGRGMNAPDKPWLDNWPVTMTSFYLFPMVAEGTPNSGVIGSFDGQLAAVIHGNANLPFIMPMDPGEQTKLNQTPPNLLPIRSDELTGEPARGVTSASRFGELTKAFQPNSMLPLFGHPSVADIDQDGTLDVIAQGSSLNLAINLQAGSSNSSLKGEHLVAVWSGKTGKMLPGSPFVLEDYSFFNSQAVADLDGDDYPEIIVGSGGYFLHAFNGCGIEPEGWPKFTGQWIIPTPAVGDLDGDKKLEVVTGTRNGWLYAWHTEGRSDGMVQWESYHHDNRNTGNFETPLEQGDPTRQASEPLSVAFCAAALADAPVPLEPGGGCACRVATAPRGGTNSQHWAWLVLALAFGARRKKHCGAKSTAALKALRR
jgi:MYXO-CTERM domain-containing protein